VKSDSETKTVEVSVRVPGSPEVVFPYFTDAEKYVQWKGFEAEQVHRFGWTAYLPRIEVVRSGGDPGPQPGGEAVLRGTDRPF